MVFLPIVGRELQVAARQRGTYWRRLGTALAAIGLGGWLMLVGVFRRPQELGLALFTVFSVIAYLYALFAGLGRTTACLSEEKREQTLGLLFLTDLKGYDVVFGKLAASSLHAAYGLLGIVPVMAIPLLVGGVTGAEFGRVVLVLANTLLFSLSVGLFCSAISRDEQDAAFWAAGLLLLFTAGLPLAGQVVAGRLHGWPHPAFLVPSPACSALMAFDSIARKYAQFNYYWASVACVLGLSCVFLALACYIVPRTWQVKSESAVKLRWLEWLQRRIFGGPRARGQMRRRLLEINPYFWLAARGGAEARLAWSCLAGIFGLFAWGAWPHSRKTTEDFIALGIIVHTWFKFGLGTVACRRLLVDRQSGALEVLLATPLTERGIIGGQCRALWAQFAGPVMVLVAADVVVLWRWYEADWVLGWAGMTVVFVADLITLSWVGMWMGLSKRNLHRAAGATLGLIVVSPWVLAFMFSELLILPLFQSAVPTWWNPDWEIIVLGLCLSVANDAVLYTWSRRRLFSRLRALASDRSVGRVRLVCAGSEAGPKLTAQR